MRETFGLIAGINNTTESIDIVLVLNGADKRPWIQAVSKR